MRRKYLGIALLAALAGMGMVVGCSSSDDGDPQGTPSGDVDSGVEQDGDTPDSDTDPGADLGIDNAPQAKIVSSVDFDEPVTTSISAGPYVFVLYADKDCGVLDLTDPEAPIDRGRITTPARIVTVAYDEGNHVAYLASDKGDVLAIDMSIPGTHTEMAKLKVSSLGGGVTGMTRVGDRLFALAGNTLQPLGITRDSVTKSVTKIELQAPVTLDSPATVIDAGGGNLFIGNAQGKLQILSAPADKTAPKALGSVDMGGEIKGIVVRGSKVLGIANGAGLKAIDFVKPSAPKVLFESDEVADASGIRVFGTTLVVGLDRGAVTTLDISKINAPRAVTTNKGKLPEWVAISRGQLFFGDKTKGQVASVPPFMSGRVTGPTRDSFPLKGLVPVTLSKEIDPATVSPETVKLTCNGKEVKGAPTVMPMQHTFIFKPSEALPAGASCKLDISGVRDRQGQLVSAPSGGAAMDFTTAGEASKPVTNPGSKFPHRTDGKFTDLVSPELEGDTLPQVKNEGEWSDVTPAKGMYTYFYADFDGENLWLMNDWFYGGENIEPDCYNQFFVWTGGGSEQWDVRAYGDQHVEVRKNGVLLDPKEGGIEGGAFYGPSPNQAEPHTMYEIRVPASPGSWGVQLHDPGPTFNCHVIEQEPHPMQGSLISEGEDSDTTTTTIDISQPTPPEDVTLFAPFDEMTVSPPVKLVWQTREGLDFTIYQVQVATDPSFTFASRVLDVGTYSSSLDVPAGRLKPGQTYYWHVIAWNTAGSTTSATRKFTVWSDTGEEPDGGAGGSGAGGNDGGQGGSGGSGGAGEFEAQWSKGFSAVEPHQIAIDKATGDIVVVGRFWQPVNFGAGQLTPVYGDNETGFIAKFDKNGAAIWSKQFGESWIKGTLARVAIDADGNVIVAGAFQGELDLGGGSLSALGEDIFVVKYTPKGAHVFSKRFGGVGSDAVGGIVAGANNDIAVTGSFATSIDFGGGELVSAGGNDAFVAKLDAKGVHAWSKRFGDKDRQVGYAVAFDKGGNVVFGGQFKGGIPECGDTNSTSHVGFVALLDSQGDCRWASPVSSAGQAVSSIGTSSANDIFAGLGSADVVKVLSNGSVAWSRGWGATRSLAVDAAGNTATVGNFDGDQSGATFAAYDKDGNSLASRMVFGGSFARGEGIAMMADGSPVAVGTYSNGIDFGAGALTGNGMFLTKFKPLPLP